MFNSSVLAGATRQQTSVIGVDCALQSTDSLAPTNWINAPSGSANPATVPAAAAAGHTRMKTFRRYIQ
jgi:hypothetical protein